MAQPEQLISALGDWRAGRGPLFERLTGALARAAHQGALPAGGELPPERALAAELGVSRATVAAAYRELRERGLAVTRHGSGTVIRSVLPPPGGSSSPALAGLLARADGSTPVIDLSVGAPDLDELVSGLAPDGAELARHAAGHGYAPLGWPALRAAVAECLSRRGAPTSPEEVLITNGAQEAISLAVGIAAGDGRRIAVESPGYPGALDAIARAGGQPVAVGRDAGGLRVDELKRLLEHHHAHALYVTPSVNNPTGGRTAGHRRERLAALAAEHDFTIVEDTVLDELRYDGDPGTPLWAIAPERVLAAGSLSKVAWGGLRVGWLRAPRPLVLAPRASEGSAQPRSRRLRPARGARAARPLRRSLRLAAPAGGRAHADAARCAAERAARLVGRAGRGRLVALGPAAERQRGGVRAGGAPARRGRRAGRRQQPRAGVPRLRAPLLRAAPAAARGGGAQARGRLERAGRRRAAGDDADRRVEPASSSGCLD